jgi:hypothetical protein
VLFSCLSNCVESRTFTALQPRTLLPNVTERHKTTSSVKCQEIPLHVHQLQNNTEVWDENSETSYTHSTASALYRLRLLCLFTNCYALFKSKLCLRIHKSHHRNLSRINGVQSTTPQPSFLRIILILSSHLHLRLLSTFFPLSLMINILCPSHFHHACCISRPSHP